MQYSKKYLQHATSENAFSEELVVIMGAELEGVKGNNGDISFSKVVEYFLPRFNIDDDVLDLWAWKAAQMGNYIVHRVGNHGFKSKCYYSPRDSVNHVCTLIMYAACMVLKLVTCFMKINHLPVDVFNNRMC